MPEITFSTLGCEEGNPTVLALLSQFEQQFHCNVKVRWLSWKTGHAELNQIAFERRGADVSVIGSTWLGSYISMQSLRAFLPNEIRALGGFDAFVPVAWAPGQDYENKQPYAIPWSLGIFMLFYRYKGLESAGIDIHQAFTSIHQLEETVALLAQAGQPLPIILPGANTPEILHGIAPFVWNEGGHFRSKDGLKMLFASPEAVRGMARYFKLTRHVNPKFLPSLQGNTGHLFVNGQATIGLLSSEAIYHPTLSQAEMAETWGVAPMPPQSFVGGNCLVIWQHTKNERLSNELVYFLTGHECQLRQSHINRQFPARLSALQNMDIPQISLLSELQGGRTYHSARLWGVVEDNLIRALSSVWHRFLAEPELDVETLLGEELSPLARRLAATMSSY